MKVRGSVRVELDAECGWRDAVDIEFDVDVGPQDDLRQVVEEAYQGIARRYHEQYCGDDCVTYEYWLWGVSHDDLSISEGEVT